MDWIEQALGIEPDKGNGIVELALALLLVIAVIALLRTTRRVGVTRLICSLRLLVRRMREGLECLANSTPVSKQE